MVRINADHIGKNKTFLALILLAFIFPFDNVICSALTKKLYFLCFFMKLFILYVWWSLTMYWKEKGCKIHGSWNQARLHCINNMKLPKEMVPRLVEPQMDGHGIGMWYWVPMCVEVHVFNFHVELKIQLYLLSTIPQWKALLLPT